MLSFLAAFPNNLHVVRNDPDVDAQQDRNSPDGDVLVECQQEHDECPFHRQQHRLVPELVKQLTHERIGFRADASTQSVMGRGDVGQLEDDEKVDHLFVLRLNSDVRPLGIAAPIHAGMASV